jgi:hypothetical protein
VIVMAGRDLVDILKTSGLDTSEAVQKHLRERYPRTLDPRS